MMSQPAYLVCFFRAKTPFLLKNDLIFFKFQIFQPMKDCGLEFRNLGKGKKNLISILFYRKEIKKCVDL